MVALIVTQNTVTCLTVLKSKQWHSISQRPHNLGCNESKGVQNFNEPMLKTNPLKGDLLVKQGKKRLAWPMGLAVGLLNGFFGSGGGMIGVPMLRMLGLETQESHATCIAVIAPLAAVSAGLYLYQEAFVLKDALLYLPGGLVGALAGAWLLPRLKTVWLRRGFGILILFAAYRLLSR